MTQNRTGILLLQVGSPERPSAWAVARYLSRFLTDPRLIDLPNPWRWILVNLIIVPFRCVRSAKAYASIWTREGSPLVVHTKALAEGLQARLGDDFVVRVGMAFGDPSIDDAVADLQRQGVERLLAMPLFPQGSSATTAATTAATMEALVRAWDFPALRVAEPFYHRREFAEAWRAVVSDELDAFQPDHVLFSFHGLPLNHLLKGRHCNSGCLQAERCQKADQGLPSCYRGQSEQTARLLAEACQLPADRWSLSYQSRLGRAAWLEPSTKDRLTRLGGEKTRLAVISPAFTADCLETLEELGIAGKERFLDAGGEDFLLLPCLNAHPQWIQTLDSICRRELEGWTTSP